MIKRLRHIFSLLKPTCIVNGAYFKVPVKLNIVFGKTMSNSQKALGQLITHLKIKDGYIIDIGANIGQTLLALKAVNENISYIGFESNVNWIIFLEELIKLNKFNNCRVVPCGLSNKLEIGKFFRNPKDLVSSGTTFKNNIKEVRGKLLGFSPLFTLDHFCKQDLIFINDISLIKIDVEGLEPEVLEGGNTTI